VIARAREVLALLEGEAEQLVPGLAPGAPPTLAPLVRGRPHESRSARMRPAQVDQLALFAPAVPHPAVDRLRGVDVNSLTPLAALQLLADLVERAKQG
jgi:hypothetical protein